jgi:hypothetical protein
MPRSPNGSRSTDVTAVTTTLAASDFAFLLGVEAAIDRALDGHRPGESFVYGIHQEMPAGVAEALEARYRAAGWAEARVKRGETGAHLVVLVP